MFRDGTLPYQRYRAWQVAGRTAGLVGLGAVGRATRWRLEGLGMHVISFDPYSDDATHDSLDALLADADVVSMHAAPTPETFAMIGREAVRQHARREPCTSMPRAPACTTPTRSPTRCASGHLGGAGLDHFDGEQLPAGHPLLDMDNVVLTPHIGGATYDTEVTHSQMIADDVARLLRGERPLHCVNPEVLS